MIRTLRFGLFAAACSLATAAAAQAPLPSPAERARVWPQSYSDLNPDPAVRFGTLANGMRYAIMRNATPTKQAALRLRIGSGSLNESDPQQGLAHFLEHMAFKGSTHVPEGDMIKILERKGLAFGPDTNAFTSFDETVYMLDLPETDAATLDTGLMLMREVGSELTLSAKAFEPERGVVLSEERLRDSPGYRALKAQLEAQFKGQLVPRRLPIGQVDVIRTAPVSLLQQFYRDNYRPDRATLIAVGDFDPAEMEAKIRGRFSDWRVSAPAKPEPELGRVAERGPEIRLFVQDGAPASIQASWAAAYDDTPDTDLRRRRDIVEQLGLAVLNRRLDRLAKSPNPPFISARAARRNAFKSAKLAGVSATTAAGGWSKGLDAILDEQRRAVQYGVTQEELDREITEYRAVLTTAATGAATRQTPALASELAQSVNENEVFTSPGQDLALFEKDVRGLTAGETSAALKTAFQGTGPVIYLTSPTAVDGGEAAVRAAFQTALARAVTPPTVELAKAWPYTSFGAPGRVVETRRAADVGVSFVRFANNVQLTVKPTQFRKDQILVSVRVGGGRLSLPRDRASVTWAAPALTQGGTRQLTREEIDRIFASRIASDRFAVGEDAFTLSGATRPADFAAQMQLLTAFVVDPGFRPEAFQRTKTGLGVVLNQIEATPSGVLARDLPLITHSGDPRWTALPTREQLAAAQPGDLEALLRSPLASGAIEVTVVGDVTVEQATAAVAATLGALPARPLRRAPSPAALQVRFPAPGGEPVLRLHKGRPDQAMVLVAWPTRDFFADPQEARAIEVAARVFQSRLIDQVRIAEGATYSPNAQAAASHLIPGYGFALALVETPPAKIDSFYRNVAKIVADMNAKEPTADELERARKPAVETLLKSQQTNEYWLASLGRATADPRELQAVRTAVSGLQQVSAADVRRVAQTYLRDGRALRVVIRSPNPAPGAPEQKPITPPTTTPTTPPVALPPAGAQPPGAARPAVPAPGAPGSSVPLKTGPSAPATPAPVASPGG